MITCPLCEHSQAGGSECELCGKALVPPKPIAVPAGRLPELESTEAGAVPDLPVERLAELEATLQPPVQASAVPLPELERTGTAPVAVVAVLMPEMDVGRFADDGVRTAAPTGASTCRYCRNVQATGAICEKCGMRLPVGFAAQSAQVANEGWVQCKCGVPAQVGVRCRSCGVFVRAVEP